MISRRQSPKLITDQQELDACVHTYLKLQRRGQLQVARLALQVQHLEQE